MRSTIAFNRAWRVGLSNQQLLLDVTVPDSRARRVHEQRESIAHRRRQGASNMTSRGSSELLIGTD